MGASDNFIMSDNTAKELGKGIAVAGIWGRIFGYLFIYIIIVVMIFGYFILSAPSGGYHVSTSQGFINLVLISTLPTIPFILVDWFIRVKRRRFGFSPWKNVSEELKQRAVNERVAREMKAQGTVSGEKRDLNYWYALKEKGAITDKEYEAKKKELM